MPVRAAPCWQRSSYCTKCGRMPCFVLNLRARSACFGTGCSPSAFAEQRVAAPLMLLPVPQAAARAQGDWRRVAAGITTRSNHSMHAGLRQDKSSAHVPAFGCSDVPGRLEGGGGVSSQAHAWRSCEQRSCLTQVCINHLTFRLLEPRRAVHCHCRCALPRAGSTRTARSTSRLTAWWRPAPRARDVRSTTPATSARPGPRHARPRWQRSAHWMRTRTLMALASCQIVM